MKKFVLLSVILAFVQFAHAQTEKGNQTLGLNLQFNRSTSAGVSISPYDNNATTIDQKYTVFAFGPNYSYFVANKLDLGGSLNYAYSKSDNGDGYVPTKTVDRTYGGNIFLRKYIMFQNNLGIRTGPFAGYSHSTSQSTNAGVKAINDADRKSNSYTGGINLELLFYPVKQMGVSLMLANINYSHYKTDSANLGKTDGDSISTNFVNNGLGVSVFYVFGN